MTLVESLVLAVVQALTEFLPVSSSGHLAVAGARVADLGGAEKEAFFVLLHAASALAVLAWLARDLAALLRRRDRLRSLLVVGVGCLPAGIAGVAWKVLGGEGLFDQPLVAAAGWLACGVFLWRTRGHAEGSLAVFDAEAPVPWRALLWIGLAQAAALVPGVSRSGATIGMALLAGVLPREAFRFSFLMALPLILGAQALEMGALADLAEAAGPGVLAAGAGACFAVSLLALGLLQHTVRLRRLHWFAPYCVLAGLATIAGVVAGLL